MWRTGESLPRHATARHVTDPGLHRVACASICLETTCEQTSHRIELVAENFGDLLGAQGRRRGGSGGSGGSSGSYGSGGSGRGGARMSLLERLWGFFLMPLHDRPFCDTPSSRSAVCSLLKALSHGSAESTKALVVLLDQVSHSTSCHITDS